jgi:gas vesicle protein
MTGAHLDSPDRWSGFLFGVACGAIIGVGVGLLFAPTSGSQARTWVATEGRKAARRVTDRLSRQDATDIVRRKGVRGLLAVLRGGTSATGQPDTF